MSLYLISLAFITLLMCQGMMCVGMQARNSDWGTPIVLNPNR